MSPQNKIWNEPTSCTQLLIHDKNVDNNATLKNQGHYMQMTMQMQENVFFIYYTLGLMQNISNAQLNVEKRCSQLWGF